MNRQFRQLAGLIDDMNGRDRYDLTLAETIHRVIRYHQEQTNKQTMTELIAWVSEQLALLHMHNVYVGIKWLIFSHTLMQKLYLKGDRLHLQKIIEGLEEISSGQRRTKFQDYLGRKLFNSYRQYLKKVSQIYITNLQSDSSEQQIQSSKGSLYAQYNLIIYSIAEFQPCIIQFSSFFSQHYPILNLYHQVIANDLHPFFQQLQHVIHHTTTLQLSFIEADIVQHKLKMFRREDTKLQKSLQKTKDRSVAVDISRRDEMQEKQVSAFEDEGTNAQLFQIKN